MINIKTYWFILISTVLILLAIYFCYFKSRSNFVKIPNGYYLYETKLTDDVQWAGDKIVYQKVYTLTFKTILK